MLKQEKFKVGNEPAKGLGGGRYYHKIINCINKDEFDLGREREW